MKKGPGKAIIRLKPKAITEGANRRRSPKAITDIEI
jgi:hypothetical protein